MFSRLPISVSRNSPLKFTIGQCKKSPGLKLGRSVAQWKAGQRHLLVQTARLSNFPEINQNIKNRVQQTINSFDSRKVADTLLTRINLTVTVAVLAVLWLVSFFREELRRFFINEAVIIGIETLSNEKLIHQTQKLAQSVVQAVLSDKELMAHVTSFFSDITAIPETRQTLMELALYVLQHPQSVDELTALSKRVIENLSKDEVSLSVASGAHIIVVCRKQLGR
jgi:hypothetical protein